MWKGRIIALGKVLNLPTRTLLQLYTYMYVFWPRDHAAAICLFPFCSLSPQKFLRGKKTKEGCGLWSIAHICLLDERQKEGQDEERVPHCASNAGKYRGEKTGGITWSEATE